MSIMIISHFFLTQVWAKRFANQYTEFELPTGWECALEGSEWVCQSTNDDRKKEAIIILAAKVRGSQDSLDQYQAYLKNTKTYTLPGGKSQISEPKYAKLKVVNGHRWIDALHLASEVPGFYTRYLATVKEDLGVALTFSVAKDHYSSYQGVFDKIIASVRVFRQKNIDLSKHRLKGKDKDLLNTDFIPEQEERIDISKQRRGRKTGTLSNEDLMLYGGLAVVVIFLLLKRKKKKKS